MAQYYQNRQRRQVKRKAFRIALFITLAMITTLLLQAYFNSLDGIKVMVSGENYTPVVAEQDARVLEQVVSDGEWVDQGKILFRLANVDSKKDVSINASTAGLFYALESQPETIEQGDVLGFVKINQPANALHLQLQKGQEHNFNIGDTIILSREDTSLEGKVTLLLGEREQGSGQKIGIAFVTDNTTLALLPGTEFELHAPKPAACQSSDCG